MSTMMVSTTSKRQYRKFTLGSKCRICLTKSLNDMTDLNSPLNKHSRDLMIFKALEFVMGEEILLGNEYPNGICGICLSLLTIAYDLKIEYFKSQNLLVQNTATYNSEDDDLIMKQDLQDNNLFVGNKNIGESDGNSDIVTDDISNETNVVEVEFENEENHSNVDLVEGAAECSDNLYILNEGNILNGETEAMCLNDLDLPMTSSSSGNNEPDESFGSQSVLTINTNTEVQKTISSLSKFPCGYCKRSFKSVEYLKKHILVCKKFQNLECYICQKKFKTKKSLTTHTINMHLTGKNVTIGGKNMNEIDLHCKLCNKVCTNKKNLSYHMSTHKEKVFGCEECGKMFGNKSVFEKHKQTHKRETKVICPICGKAFHYDSGLFYHMKMHTNERKYECSYCPKTFYNMCGLKRHERVHTGERPYTCQYCKRAFRSQGEKRNHEYLHTGERPFQCEVCATGFTKPYNLHIHQMTHTGEYKCDYCPKGFITQKILRFHLNIKHGVKADKVDAIGIESTGNDKQQLVFDEEDSNELDQENEENGEYDMEEFKFQVCNSDLELKEL